MDIYRCKWSNCAVEFTNVIRLVDHLSSHIVNYEIIKDDDQPYQCLWKDCGICSHDSDAFRCHLFYHVYLKSIQTAGAKVAAAKQLPPCLREARPPVEAVEPFFRCQWANCQEQFHSPFDYYCHVEDHFGDSSLECLWNGCASDEGNISFPKRSRLSEHVHSHTKKKVVACPTCAAPFSNTVQFVQHRLRQQQKTGQLFSCPYCSKQFASEAIMRKHAQSHVNFYKCPFCDMTCAHPSSLKRHITYVHVEEKRFQCSLCSYSCKTKNDLDTHTALHDETRMFQCSFESCPYAARSMNSIRQHFKTYHENKPSKQFACHLCDKKFTRGQGLSNHLVKAHNLNWPSGFKRFRYKLEADGFYRLITVRFESVEVVEELMQGQNNGMEYSYEENDDDEDEDEEEDDEEEESSEAIVGSEDNMESYFESQQVGLITDECLGAESSPIHS